MISGVSKKILKFSRKFSPTRFRESNLEQIANNIDAFALNGNIGYILHVNKQETPDRVSQQHAAKLMSWLDEYAKSSNNPKKIYQSIGDIMINLSNQKDKISERTWVETDEYIETSKCY